jgi:16S rRNA processing protein RimM
MAELDAEDYLIVGRIGAPYGVRGWVKIFSYTEHPENLLDYDPWFLGKQKVSEAKSAKTGQPSWRACVVEEAKTHGKGIVAKLQGCDDRDAATLLRGLEIAIHKEQLPPAEEGEYYWVDLIGLKVENLAGVSFGRVDHLLETGANDVLVVKGEAGEPERLIPYVMDVFIKEVDLDAGIIRVDWEADY